jgi:hypothetical protein
MGTVDTSTSALATAYSNQRKVDRCQNGNLWVTFWNGTSTTSTSLEFWYSSDNGSTWTEDTAGRLGFAGTGTTYTPNSSLFVDVDDYAHLVYKDRHNGGIYYRRGTPNGARTAYTWSAAQTLSAVTDFDYPDVVAHREGTGWTAHMVISRQNTNVSGGAPVVYSRWTIASDGTMTGGGGANLRATNYGTGSHTWPSVDFNHTGDGKTVAGSTPHIYAAWSAGTTGADKGIRFIKGTYASGSWTWGTERAIDETSMANEGHVSSIFDGTRVVIVYRDSAATTAIKVRDRDAADTATTAWTPPALSDGTIQAISVNYDNAKNIHLWAVGATSQDPKRVRFERAAGTWNTWTTVSATTALANTLSLRRGFSSSRIDAVVTEGAGSPYNVVHHVHVVNTAPTAPAWTTTNNQPADVAASLPLAWTFTDPDPGDTQSAYALSRQIGAGALAYWNAGSSSWGASETKNVSSTSSVTIPSGWGADPDADHRYRVKTWDSFDAEGTYSTELTVIPSAKSNPTITTPASGGTVTTATFTVVWTVSSQSAYRVRLLTSGDVQLETSGWVTSGTKSHALTFAMTTGTTYKAEVTTRNVEGLQSNTVTHTFSTSFTPPSTPTLVVSENPTGALRVVITNPGGGATVAYNDVLVRVATGGRQIVDRPVAGDGIRIATAVASGGTYTDRVVASGAIYQYRVRVWATNGTSAVSAWTA